MSNIDPNNFLGLLAGLVQSIVDSASPEAKEAMNRLKNKAAKTESSKEQACDCPGCTFRKAFGDLAKKEEKEVGFRLTLAGTIPPHIGAIVGDIKTSDVLVSDSKTATRIMAALLINSSEATEASTEDLKILQMAAVDHFTKGIKALNALRAETA